MGRGRPKIAVPASEELAAALAAGTQDQAAEAFGCSVRTVRRWVRTFGLGRRRRDRGPRRVPKLDSERAKVIRTLYATEDYTQAQLAAMFGVSQSMIARVVNNKAYPEADLGTFSGSADVQVGYRHS